jgi:hydrogenase-1 operon protein HyaF
VSQAGMPQFNIQTGNELTWNVQPILHEIRHALEELLSNGKTSIIDLRTIPLAPGEEEVILNTLGKGEVHARLDVLGSSEIYESRYSGVWLITHFNENDSVVSRFIEITELPDILKSQHEDMSNALQKLAEELSTEDTQLHSETDT